MSQREIAKTLDTSQATICKYLKGYERGPVPKKDDVVLNFRVRMEKRDEELKRAPASRETHDANRAFLEQRMQQRREAAEAKAETEKPVVIDTKPEKEKPAAVTQEIPKKSCFKRLTTVLQGKKVKYTIDFEGEVVNVGDNMILNRAEILDMIEELRELSGMLGE
ncbi:MAG: hypothetical protein J6Y20_07295 [Lachnospiraceae bacterium]|nr:hypothetical protein [Lachnospiraceae bacterium]